MIRKICRNIPQIKSGWTYERPHDKDLIVKGEIVLDEMGASKTFIVLALIAWSNENIDHELHGQTRPHQKTREEKH